MITGLQAGDPRRVGPYQLLGRLGYGGMGSVFLGQVSGGDLAAVKVIRGDLAEDPGFRARFDQEVAAARKVSGQFTAAVADADTGGRMPWLATSYVPGPSLAELVRMHGALPVSSVLPLAAGLAQALGVIHAAGVVHRDLKPSNVLVSADGPRVIDFGISRAVGASALTQAGTVLGSPGFMSPEQAKGEVVGPASDVFSLGTLLGYAATGTGPFGAASMPALLYRVVYGEPSTGELPAALRPLVQRCLAREPSERPTPAELLAELGDMHPAGDWLPAPVAETVSWFADPEAALAAAAAAGQPARSGREWLPMTGSQLPGAAQPQTAADGELAGAVREPAGAVLELAGVAGQVPETGMELSALDGEPALAGAGAAGPGRQPLRPSKLLRGLGSQPAEWSDRPAWLAGPSLGAHHLPPDGDDQPTMTVVRPPQPGGAPRPDAAAVVPPRHPERRRRFRLGAAGAGVVAACAVVAVLLSGVLQPAIRHTQPPARSAARLPDPAAVLKARGGHPSAHPPAAHRHRHRAAMSGSGVTMAVTSSPSPAGGQPAVASGSPSPAAPTPSSAAPAPSSQPSSTQRRAVPGSTGWTDTGITVQAGDRLSITAAGEIYVAAVSASEGPGGNPACTPATTYPAQSAQFPAPGLPCWSLIGRIGGGAPFEVGSSAQLTATSGELYLGVDDDSFTGNSGNWSATVTVRPYS
jgi:Protein kinase domain